eukprot:scaffold38978_cov48-Phaeocystis_antarctica.AAC.4
MTPEPSPYSRWLLFAWPSPMLCPNSCARVGPLSVRMSDQHAPARGVLSGREHPTCASPDHPPQPMVLPTPSGRKISTCVYPEAA